MQKAVTLLAFVAVLLVSAVVVLAVSIGLGWALTLLLPFVLFEGVHLVMMAMLVGGFILLALILVTATGERESEPEEQWAKEWEDEWPDPDQELPTSIYWTRPEERTWENWFRYTLANSAFEDLAVWSWEGPADVDDVVDWSVQLGDAALAVLKRQATRGQELFLTPEIVGREIEGEMWSDDDDDEIIELAVVSINVELGHLRGDLARVAREEAWDQPADRP